jgi:hypothetical protein
MVSATANSITGKERVVLIQGEQEVIVAADQFSQFIGAAGGDPTARADAAAALSGQAFDLSARVRLADVVTPELFGAVGDGVSDDTAALSAMLATGKNAIFTWGKTYLSGKLTVSTVGQRINGNGATLKLKGGVTPGAMISLNADKASVTGAIFDGNASLQTTTNGGYDHSAVNIANGTTGCVVDSNTISNMKGMGITGGATIAAKITKNIISLYGVHGIFLAAYTADGVRNVIEKNELTMPANKGVGIYLFHDNAGPFRQRRWRVCDNIIEGPATGMTTLDIPITIRGIEGVCTGNVVNGGSIGISLDAASDSLIAFNKITGDLSTNALIGLEVNNVRNCINSNVISGYQNLFSCSGPGDDNVITSNVFSNWGSAAIYFAPAGANTAQRILIANNKFKAAVTSVYGIRLKGAGVSASDIRSNSMIGPGGSVNGPRAIYLDTTSGNASICSNRMSGWQRAIGLYSGAALAFDHIHVNDNDVSMDMIAGTALVNLEGAATIGANCTLVGNIDSGGLYREWQDLATLSGTFRGNGSPEANTAAGLGSTYRRLNGSTATSFYVKEGGGSGNTGWVAK